MAEIDLKDGLSVGKITRYTGSMTMSSLVNLTKSAAITFSRAYRTTPKCRNVGTDSTEGISVTKSVHTLSSVGCTIAFRQGSPTLTTDTTITVFADIDGEF
jgi:hypothetical protein